MTTINFKHRLPRTRLLTNRTDWLLDECAGKKVVHIGCVDSGMTQERVDRRELLHSRLSEVTSALLGVDVDKKGLEALRSLGFDELLAADVSRSSRAVIESVSEQLDGCDVIICGEVIEHVPDIGRFLTGLRKLAGEFGSRLIITTPNAFSIRTLFGIIAGFEIVHSDHKCYLSWKTLETMLTETGFDVERILYYSNENVSASGIMRFLKTVFNRTIFRVRPHLAEGIIMVAEPR